MRIILTGKNGLVGYELQRSPALLGEVIALGRAESKECTERTFSRRYSDS